jgi:hypothetical protein
LELCLSEVAAGNIAPVKQFTVQYLRHNKAVDKNLDTVNQLLEAFPQLALERNFDTAKQLLRALPK